MANDPIVSVIIPTKNSASTLERCLQSIQEQTYESLEIIVVDNFSTDATPSIAKRYTTHFYQKGPERCTQRNFAVTKARGAYVAIIDSDMYLSRYVIADCVKQIETKGTEGVIIPERSIGKGFWAQCKALERSFYVGVSYMEAARFFRRSTFLRLGGYDESMVSGEDWDFSQRVQRVGLLATTSHDIKHDEQRISLFKTIKKKFYYAKNFARYTSNNKSTPQTKRQISLFGRYKLFFSHPRKLFRNPILGLGMLFMKTCEFGFGGLGFLVSKFR